MKVFVAGATGTLGMALVRELVSGGHEVVGMTRTQSKLRMLEEHGAHPVLADALDADATQVALRAAEPEAVISVLTSLPRTGPKRMKDLEPTNRLREHGTRNLMEAALSAGVRRFVGESIIAVYGYDTGEDPATEERAAARESRPGLQRAIAAILASERCLREATDSGRIESVSLRFGFYHGAAAPNTRYMLEMLRRRRLPVIGGGRAVHSWIDLEDAAHGTAIALERGTAGSVYNVVDDEPVEFCDYVGELGRLAGAEPPRNVPYGVARLAMPYAALFLARARIAASNAKLKRELGWQLRRPTFREALAPLASGPT